MACRGRSSAPRSFRRCASISCRAHASYPPSGLARYCPNAGRPLAASRRPAGNPRSRCPARPPPRISSGRAATARTAASTASRPRAAGRQSVHVVALERVDVASQQLAVGDPSGCRRRSPARGPRLQRRPGPLQRAVDRRHRGVEQLGDLGRLPAQHLAQDQHGALARRQVLQRGDERQPDRLARDRPARPDRATRAARGRRARAAPSGSPASGRPSGLVGGARPAEIHRRARRWLASACRSRRCGDAVQPRAHAGAALEPVEVRQARISVSCTASSASEPEPSMR